ncbi:hypothetical protein TrRE_jg12307, partial [Triparma retinervis]
GKGSFVGLSLGHGRGHIWRSILEGVALGTSSCISGLRSGGHSSSSIFMAGGATRSELWLQMHADATGTRIVVAEFEDAPIMGGAVLASVGAGVHGSVKEAVGRMVKVKRVVEPIEENVRKYETMKGAYEELTKSVRTGVGMLKDIRGGDGGGQTISPSLLSADWANMEKEIRMCEECEGVERLHCDVFDGVEIKDPLAMTFGPKMIADIRRKTTLKLDIHLVTVDPVRYVGPMGDAGADCLIVQYESFEGGESLRKCLEEIKAKGMERGVSVAPKTDIQKLGGLLGEGVVDVVDVLTVEPCFAAQEIQLGCLEKVKSVKREFPDVRVMVDGGVNGDTIEEVRRSGADVIVSGSFVFKNTGGVKEGVRKLGLGNV